MIIDYILLGVNYGIRLWEKYSVESYLDVAFQKSSPIVIEIVAKHHQPQQQVTMRYMMRKMKLLDKELRRKKKMGKMRRNIREKM